MCAVDGGPLHAVAMVDLSISSLLIQRERGEGGRERERGERGEGKRRGEI